MSANLFRAISYLEGIYTPHTTVDATAHRGRAVGPATPTCILVAVDLAGDVDRALTLVRAIARDAGSAVRLVAVHPVPEPIRDQIGRVRITSEVLIDRLEASTLDGLRRLARLQLDGVRSSTAVIFGDADVEIARDAEAFTADLVVFTAEPHRPWPGVLRRLAASLAWPAGVIQVRYRSSQAAMSR